MARDPRSAGERLSEGVRTLLTGANFAHLSTLMPDGAPNVDPVWVDVEGDMVVVCSGAGALKSKNARRDPRVGLSVIAMDNPYQEAQIRGRVVEQRPDPNFATIDRIAKKYTGKPFPLRGKPQERVVLMIAVERARYTALPFVHAPEGGN